MWMEDGFSYTKSELQVGDTPLQERRSSSSTGSESDELSTSIVEKQIPQAQKANRTIDNRMKYFKKHLKLLRFEQGRIVDPFRLHLLTTFGPDFKSIKMDWKESGLGAQGVAMQKQQSVVQTDRKESGMFRHKSPSRAMIGRSVSDDFQSSLEQLLQNKVNEEAERRLTQYHRIRMKKLITIEKLCEYAKMLENKQQQRLIEEHRTSFRSFQYKGPSREGALFCLREKYRRERKAIRVKYAKKYGLSCRQVRLEKRLMRKAKRLLTRERILNALKERTRSKLILLMEMRYEFMKLVEKLKLNKEIQEKIRRQDRLNTKPGENKDKKALAVANSSAGRRRSVFSGVQSNTNLETAEVQKLPAFAGKPYSITSLSSFKLPKLPSVPLSTNASSSDKLPPIKHSTVLWKKVPKASTTDMRCPQLIQDKKLGAGKFHSGTSSVSGHALSSASPFQNLSTKTPKARVARSVRGTLPLINESKYGTAPFENGFDDKEKSHTDNNLPGNSRYQREARLSETEVVGSPPRQETSRSKEQKRFDEVKDKKRVSSKSNQKNIVSKLISDVNFPEFPDQRNVPVGFVRKSDVNRIPRYKYKTQDTNGLLAKYGKMYQKCIEDDLRVMFGSNKSESYLNRVVKDISSMAEFIFDHLNLLPEKDVYCMLKELEELRDERQVTLLKMMGEESDTHNASDSNARLMIKQYKDQAVEDLKRGYKTYELELQKKRQGHVAHKTLRRRIKKNADESKIMKKKGKRKSLADKLLLQRGHQFNNPVRVTTKLGGRLMLQGWKTLPFDEYVTLGLKLEVEKSGWRKDGMEHYEVIAPHDTVDNLKYLLILNRLDLTPRRFCYPGYNFNPNIVQMFKYCSAFYRNYMLRKGDRRTDKDKHRSSHQDNQSRARVFFGTALLQGEFRVPHLRHKIFTTPPNALETAKPKDKNTPLVFSKRKEISDDDEEPKKLRIQLVETETLDLWSFESRVAPKGTEDALLYAKDTRRMKKYNSRFHRCFEVEVQTDLTNTLDRSTQMYAPNRDSKKTNVYETDIVKASEDLPPPVVKTIKVPGFQEDDVSDPSIECSASSVESFPDENRRILTSSEFLSRVRLTLRIMDSMIYSDKQLTFRKGLDMDPLDPKAEISYSHERLFSFIDKRIALSEYVVTSMDWSSVNPNLLAVGYARHPLYPEQDKGMICIWNVKMITKYERKFEFKNGVTHLQFCIPYPCLLNVALLDGSVLILDLGAKKNLVVTTKLSRTFSNYKPVWQFSWIELEKGNFIPVTCGDNGFIHQLRPDGTFQHSKFLSLGHREGKVKGIKISSSMGLKPRIRGRPGITCLEKHPTDPILYLVGTSDGCVHICSIYFRNQHLDVFSAHIGAVKGIQFHPHCEHVFLTYGEDFYVRVWLYGTFEPALELMGGNFYVRGAQWSPAYPEILVSISNKNVDVWDIRRKTDYPIHRFKNPRELENTALIFDKTGRNIVLGNNGGDVYVYALKNMPFSHYFKGEAIASALEKVLKAKKKFVRDIRKLGYPFGAQKDTF